MSVRSRSSAAVTAQIASAAQASTVCRAIAWKRRTWDWSRPKQLFRKLEFLFDWPAKARGPHQPRLALRCPSGT